ncbi:MAG: glycosyltransferase, partial [Candidatus Peribacter sp.]|nr:glycosyltransferase [Candidatus Peribacter sp.]
GHIVSIASIATSQEKFGTHTREEQGIPVTEHFTSSLNTHHEEVREMITCLLGMNNPDVILLNTPAVFFSPAHMITLEEAVKAGKIVIVMVVDELFPAADSNKQKQIERYYELLHTKNVQILGISDTVRRKFAQLSGTKPDYLPQLFNLEQVVSPRSERTNITMVNTHPIKGIDIFAKVAELLPKKKFMAVQNWVDVPKFKPGRNVTVRPFYQNPRDLYQETRMLLVPSLCQEGAARVVIEAMLNGIPVIAHRIGSLPEIGKDCISYITPPHIQGYRFEGTIMYPVVHEQELRMVATEFARKIIEVDSNYSQFSRKTTDAGLQYCRSNKEKFQKFLQRWLNSLSAATQPSTQS